MQKSNKIIIQSSRIIFPNVHDGYLVGIDYDDAKDIALKIKTIDDKKLYNIKAMGVLYFCANNLLTGNIICDVEVEDPLTGLEEFKRSLSNLRPLSSKKDVGNEKLIKKSIEEGLILVKVNPSYGAEVTIVCKELILGNP